MFRRGRRGALQRTLPNAPDFRVPGSTTVCAVGDYDNDGFKDLFRRRRPRRASVFTTMATPLSPDVTARSGLGKPDAGRTTMVCGGAWVDVNNDGLLDLFVLNYLAWNFDTEPVCEAEPGRRDYCHPKFFKPTPNQLFLNNGDGTFRDIFGCFRHRRTSRQGHGRRVSITTLTVCPISLSRTTSSTIRCFTIAGTASSKRSHSKSNVALTDRQIHLRYGRGFSGHR